MTNSSATLTPRGIDIAKATFDAAAWVDGKYKPKAFAHTAAGVEALPTILQRDRTV